MSRLDSVNGTKLITGFGDPEIKEDILRAEDKTLDETVKVIEAKESGEIESSDRADSKKSCPAYISVESVSEMDISAPFLNLQIPSPEGSVSIGTGSQAVCMGPAKLTALGPIAVNATGLIGNTLCHNLWLGCLLAKSGVQCSYAK